MKTTRFIFVLLTFYLIACDAPHKTPQVNDSTSSMSMSSDVHTPQSNLDSSPSPSTPPSTPTEMDPADSSDPIIMPDPEMEPEPPTPLPPEDCQPNEAFFEEHVWRPIIKPLCLDCHNPQGAAQGSDMVYVPEEQLDSLETNYSYL